MADEKNKKRKVASAMIDRYFELYSTPKKLLLDLKKHYLMIAE